METINEEISKIKISIIFTYHNRKNLTLRCIKALYNQVLVKKGKVELKFFVCDDNSEDGSSELIKKYFPEINIVYGNGNLFWAKGMHKAIDVAQKEECDFYLMINDDVLFFDNMLNVMLNSYYNINNTHCAVSGATIDQITGEYTYGGVVSEGKVKTLHEVLVQILPSLPEKECHLSNWNCFLITQQYYNEIGDIDDYYIHGMADYDYSQRIIKSGGKIYIASNYIGYCSRNSNENTWMDVNLPIFERFKLLNTIKGNPIKSYAHYCKKFYGFFWPIKVIKPYMGIIAGNLFMKIKAVVKQ